MSSNTPPAPVPDAPAREGEPVEFAQGGMVKVPRWGFQLMTALGDFLQQALDAKGPLTVSILCKFPNVPETPVVHLWATTDEQTPITRLPLVVAERDAARAELAALRDAGKAGELAVRLAAAYVAEAEYDADDITCNEPGWIKAKAELDAALAAYRAATGK